MAILNQDSGLMMEFKTLYAEKAGMEGQLLEEKDLSDAAVEDRLKGDLQLRVLATKLLARYGYFAPRVNPNSDLADEHKLYLHEREQELERVSQRPEGATLPGSMQANGCDLRNLATCGVTTQPTPAQENAAPVGQTPSITTPQVPTLPTNPNSPTNSPLLQTQNMPSANFETLLAASHPSNAASGSPFGQMSGNNSSQDTAFGGLNDSLGGLPASQSDAMSALLMSSAGVDPEKAPLPDALHGPANPTLNQLMKDYTREKGTEESFEPVAMVHKPNPYADAPSLYDLYVQAAPSNLPVRRFGLDAFERSHGRSDLPMDLPVGPDYVIGPGDSLAIDLWGGVSQRIFRTVDRQGRVALPESGPLLVSGKSLGDVQTEVQRILRTQFRDVSADVSLLRLRTIRVYVVGEVASPGAYDISALSTPLSALFSAGGVTPKGSLRRLEHYRGSQLLEDVDGYDLLLRGVRSNMARLENGDSLRVPPMGPEVTITGMVRRPAIYELRAEKNLEEVLDLAGGILPTAALRHIEVQRLDAHEKRTMFSLDLGENIDPEAVRSKMRSFTVQDGDEIHIFPIAPYNTAAVYLEGHVLRPGKYSYRDGMKLTDIIGSYKDLLPEPSNRYAEIIRLNPPDYHPVVQSFNLADALAHPENAPQLHPLDTIRIYGRYDFEVAPEFLITGEVRNPGRYKSSGQMHLQDVIYRAGGVLPDAWLDSAQVFRTQTDGTTKVFSVNLRNALDGEARDNLLIEPRDRIIIQSQPELAAPSSVYVEGDVAHPGRYPLTNDMHASDLVRAAGGLIRSANPQNGLLVHYDEATTVSTKDIPINLTTAMTGDESADAPLRAGDVLTVPQQSGWKDIGASVSIRGEVSRPGTYGIHPHERLSAVLQRAGGFGPNAYPYGAILKRRDVRDAEMRGHMELVQRVKAEEVTLRSLPENDPDQKNAKLTAVAQTESTLQQLESVPPIGRVVIHIRPDSKSWQNSADDPELEDGDELLVPKKANYVLVTGQVFNPTSIEYRSGRSAKWYLSQAGGMTQLANKKAAFVIRADGSVIAAKNNSSWFSGDPMDAVLKPGDSIVVPERTPNVGGRNWTTVMQMAQIASSVAITAAYLGR